MINWLQSNLGLLLGLWLAAIAVVWLWFYAAHVLNNPHDDDW